MGDEKLGKEQDAELEAMATVYAALKGLEPEAQNRVLDYVEKRLSLTGTRSTEPTRERSRELRQTPEEPEERVTDETESDAVEDAGDADGLEGISSLAQKWMKRSSLTASQLSELYSLGVDEIDLVANTVPGGTTKEKFRSVVLLQGIASFLSSGTPRVTNEKLKQSVTDYDADAGSNWAAYMKSFASEVSGSKESGYTLTAKGLVAAKGLIATILEKHGKGKKE